MPRPHKIVNSERSRDEFIDQIYRDFDEKKYTTYDWRYGADRSLDQNSLFHVWLTEYAAHLLKIPKKDVTKAMLDGMKIKVKQSFYRETAQRFMLHRIIDPWHPDKSRTAWTSSGDWSPGEMYMVLNWIQYKAADDGLALEAIGKYAKHKRRENGE